MEAKGTCLARLNDTSDGAKERWRREIARWRRRSAKGSGADACSRSGKEARDPPLGLHRLAVGWRGSSVAQSNRQYLDLSCAL